MNRKIISAGTPFFPLGFAQVQRQLMLAKALVMSGYEVTVLCRYGMHNLDDNLPANGVFEGIKYTYCSGRTARPGSYLERNLLKFWGLINEIKLILKFSKAKELGGVLISTNSFHNVLFYHLVGKMTSVPFVIDNVEHWTSINCWKGVTRIEKYLYDKYYYVFFDNIICISDFLISMIRKSAVKKIVKIPAITDFEKFDNTGTRVRKIEEKYFLYCGSDFYLDVIDFVISSFEKLDDPEVMLIIVSKENNRIRERISRGNKKNLIRLLANLPYEELIDLYQLSEGLILPMRNSDQDKARFPHKISEYCASKRPIITNKVGEISNYFDESNAYICSDYDEQHFADAMESIITDPDHADRIGLNSYNTGIKNFNYRSYSKALSIFFNNL